MYEVTVSTPSEQNYLLDHLSRDMLGYLAQIDGTYTMLHQKHRSYFCLACSDTFRFQTQRLLEDSVARVLSLGYKNIFVRRLLDLQEPNFYQNVLIDTLCTFDHQYEANLLVNVLDCNNNIFMDGYYNFRMCNFKRKWENVVNMILENDYILSDDQLILEFLQYLLQSGETKTKQLSICFDDDGYNLYDSKGKVMQSLSTLSPIGNVEEEAIVNAICLNVQTLRVYHSHQPSQEFCHLAKSLFDVQFVEVQ